MAQQMISVYEEFASQVAAMPVVVGRKSAIESFAGANRTYTIEAMMGDRRALQVRHQGCAAGLRVLLVFHDALICHFA